MTFYFMNLCTLAACASCAKTVNSNHRSKLSFGADMAAETIPAQCGRLYRKPKSIIMCLAFVNYEKAYDSF